MAARNEAAPAEGAPASVDVQADRLNFPKHNHPGRQIKRALIARKRDHLAALAWYRTPVERSFKRAQLDAVASALRALDGARL